MIRAENICKSFGQPPTQVLTDLNFEIKAAALTSITGRSGSGKSTLLYLLSTLANPSSGNIYFDDVNVNEMTEVQVHNFRNTKMGFIFQFHYLLPELPAIENVLMPTRKTGVFKQKYSVAESLLAQFGLAEKKNRLPRELSGGEQQRVAIARALIMDPSYVFADEPTGNLDSTNGEIVMGILKEITQTKKTTVIYVTHDKDFADMADYKLQLTDGKLTI